LLSVEISEKLEGMFSADQEGLIDCKGCNGYLGYPFTKLTIWSFTTFLFFFGKWYSIMEVIGKFF
jgi:hypothetical protein